MPAFIRHSLCAAALVGALGLAPAIARADAPPTPATFSVTFDYYAAKYHFTANWSASPGATYYVLLGHAYSGANTSRYWVVPDNYEDLSISITSTPAIRPAVRCRPGRSTRRIISRRGAGDGPGSVPDLAIRDVESGDGGFLGF